MKSIASSQQEQVTDETNRFRTYLNYFDCVDSYISATYPKPEEFTNPIIRSKTFVTIQGGKTTDMDRLERCLRNAWFTEIQMILPSKFPDMLHFVNHWICVQTYYSVYLALRALSYAQGANVGREHASNLNYISQLIKNRKGLIQTPFCCYAEGNPEKNSTLNFGGLPRGHSVSQISNLTNAAQVHPIDSLAKFLKTTRKSALEKLFTEWKEKEKKNRMDPTRKQEIIQNLPPTSLFQCFYRMRIRANYTDADSFLMSIVKTSDSKRFYECQTNILWHVLLNIELLIARYMGKSAFKKIMDDFLTYDTTNISDALVRCRYEVFSKQW